MAKLTLHTCDWFISIKNDSSDLNMCEWILENSGYGTIFFIPGYIHYMQGQNI